MGTILNVPVILADGTCVIEQVSVLKVIKHDGLFVAVVERENGYALYEVTTCGLLFTCTKHRHINRHLGEYDFSRAGWTELDRRVHNIALTHPAYNFNLHIVTGDVLQPRLSAVVV